MCEVVIFVHRHLLCLMFAAKRQDEDYDEQVEETLQDEVSHMLIQCSSVMCGVLILMPVCVSG